MQFDLFQSLIPKIRQKQLAGRIAHAEIMDMKLRYEIFRSMQHQEKIKQAAVLALLYPSQDNKTNIVFILRKKYDGYHSGQIAFPGGKKEKTDRNLLETALREAQEEVNILPESVKIIKPLSEVQIPVSNYNVQPYFAYTEKRPDFIKNNLEVEEILAFPFNKILSKNLIRIDRKYFEKFHKTFAFQVDEYIIWGATAMILSEIIHLFDKSFGKL